ncbi:hypothetical protein ACQKLP_17680 [Chitinophaga sp. NPDC101104]|uniref:hypothetical protein n=1 Tax=Chitinophaga sp. NPDC101104 TaxID=3390561 RepID=UPI003D00D1B5
MNYLGQGEDLIARVAAEYNLLSGKLLSVVIAVDNIGIVNVEIKYQSIYAKSKLKVLLACKSVICYSFFYQNRSYFETIEDFKFFKSNKGFYLCFDPDIETDRFTISETDQDFILFENLEGYTLE